MADMKHIPFEMREKKWSSELLPGLFLSFFSSFEKRKTTVLKILNTMIIIVLDKWQNSALAYISILVKPVQLQGSFESIRFECQNGGDTTSRSKNNESPPSNNIRHANLTASVYPMLKGYLPRDNFADLHIFVLTIFVATELSPSP